MQNVPNPIEAAITVLSMNPPGFIKSKIKNNLIYNTRKAITIKAKADRSVVWTPELVLSRMHEDTDADVFLLFELAGIDEANLLEIAREALESIGIKCPSPLAEFLKPGVKTGGVGEDVSKAGIEGEVGVVSESPVVKNPSLMTRVNNLFKRKKKWRKKR